MARKKSRLNKAPEPPDGDGDKSMAAGSRLLIAGIGASAGGLKSFSGFLEAMPPGSGMAFVLVQHLDPSHSSILTELIRPHTEMTVVEIEDGVKVEPNTVYVIPPNSNVALLHDTLHLMSPVDRQGSRMPIDFLFRSLAEDQGERAIGIILSGTGTDGTLGLKAIKEMGGLVLAEDPETAEFSGMPRSAVGTGMVDSALPVDQLPAELLRYISHMLHATDQNREALAFGRDDLLQKVSIILRRETGHDFSLYKSTTMGRRVERRMALNGISNPADYIRLIERDAEEVQILFQELLIGVTSFFRDPEAFDALEKHVIPHLFEKRASSQSMRLWVPGCSTGEEAYSLAMLLQQHMEQLGQQYDIQIFATDIDERAIDYARQGLYLPNIELDVPAQYLRRYFTQEGQNYHVIKQIRDMLIFAVHSVVKDPPFSKMDLISFRNVMIYFDPSLQRLVIPMLHYALNPDGFLFLGTSETLGEHDHLFKPIDRKYKIFQCVGTPVARVGLPTQSTTWLGERKRLAGALPEKKRGLRDLVERLLLRECVPAAVVVNQAGEIVYLHNPTGNYLEPVTGEPGYNILMMAREGLRLPLTGALRKVAQQKQEVVYPNLKVSVGSSVETVDLRVRPIEAPEELKGLTLVLFEPGTRERDGQREGAQREVIGDDNQRVLQLERELQATQEYLQSTIEELEVANEELKSTNEEFQSAYEELQSTNEELETAKEELQSVNEELQTVNSELQTKNEVLRQSNTDLNNLLSNIEIPIIFLDRHLNIKRFNPAAIQMVNLIPSDVGRPIQDLAPNLLYDDLIPDIREVLDTLVPKDVRVQLRDNSWHLMRVRIYRGLNNAVEGIILLFTDFAQGTEAE